MRAFPNVALRAPAPVAVSVYRHRAYGCRRCAAIAAVIDGDHIVWRTCSAQYRARIVGGFAVGYGAGDLAHAVGHDRHRWGQRGFSINGDRHRCGRGAFVACAILIGDRQGEIVGPVTQRWVRRPGPVAVTVHQRFTDFGRAIINIHHVTRVARSAQGWRGIAGRFTRVQCGTRRAAVRVYGDIRYRRCIRRDGINGEHERRRNRRITGIIRGVHRQGVWAVG